MDTCYYFSRISWLFCVPNMHVYNSHEMYILLLWTLFCENEWWINKMIKMTICKCMHVKDCELKCIVWHGTLVCAG
jgi:hypothetical protein